jgi:hypothetical protein
MPRILVAALELQAVLKETGRPFCFIGGLAIQRWGEPRMTKDAAATVVSGFEFDEEVIEILLSRFQGRRNDAAAFARHNRVLLLSASNGVGLDVALGAFDFEYRAAERAVLWRLDSGESLRVCTAEDLIVHKAFANRDHDWGDIGSILLRQGRELQIDQVLKELGPLVQLKEDDSILPRLEKLLREVGLLPDEGV